MKVRRCREYAIAVRFGDERRAEFFYSVLCAQARVLRQLDGVLTAWVDDKYADPIGEEFEEEV